MSNAKNSLDEMLAQYQEVQDASSDYKSSSFDLKNYFSTFLAKNEKSATRKIRILPTANGSSPFVVMYGHKLQVEGEWKTFACLKEENDGAPCPFCEAKDALMADGTEKSKTLAKNYSSRKYYIIKVIDRDKEEDGVKFWRFPHDYRNTGMFDKIMSVIKNLKSDITSATTGRDLFINLAKDTMGKTQVQSIIQDDVKVLTEDAALSTEWLGDERTWHKVYSVKPYDYLYLIVQGHTPVWDKELKKYVSKNSTETTQSDTEKLDSELTLGLAENVKTKITTASTNVASEKEKEAELVDAEADDDLPF